MCSSTCTLVLTCKLEDSCHTSVTYSCLDCMTTCTNLPVPYAHLRFDLRPLEIHLSGGILRYQYCLPRSTVILHKYNFYEGTCTYYYVQQGPTCFMHGWLCKNLSSKIICIIQGGINVNKNAKERMRRRVRACNTPYISVRVVLNSL